MGVKLLNEKNDSMNKTIMGKVEYCHKKQRELSYVIEKDVEIIGSIMCKGPKEGQIQFEFPGFVWTVLMSR